LKHNTTNTKPDLPLHDTTDKFISVVLFRHAQSQWNKVNRFTGWADPPLTGCFSMKNASCAAAVADFRLIP